MAEVKKFYSIFLCTKGSEGGSLQSVKSYIDTKAEAEDWIMENAEPGIYYVIIETFRRG